MGKKMTEAEQLREQIKNIHAWLTNAIPVSLYGVDLTDTYKAEVFDAIRDWLYPDAKKKDAA
jgi:hypothetical protein